MRKVLLALLGVLLLGSPGCAATKTITKPIAKTIDTVERVHNTAGKVYEATKAVHDLINPLELIFVSVAAAERGDRVWGMGLPQEIRVYDRQRGEYVGSIRLSK